MARFHRVTAFLPISRFLTALRYLIISVATRRRPGAKLTDRGSTRICILGWGSLIWDKRPEFDDQHGPWQPDGPTLKLEFSRVSRKTRLGALTLAIDPSHGAPCRVAYAESKRKNADDAVCDLRSREGTVLHRIGVMFLDGSRLQGGDDVTREAIRGWALKKKFDVVVWTDLPADFEEKTGTPFTVEAAFTHLQRLPAEGKAKAAEYVWRAPDFVTTPLRQRLQRELWFKELM